MTKEPGHCIYCAKQTPSSEEHWLPRWLGEYDGCESLFGRLCDPCNVHLGKHADHEMSRRGPEALSRYRLKIEGRHTDWLKSNPYTFKTQAAEGATAAKTLFPDLGFEVLMEDVPGEDPPARRALRQIVLRRADGSRECVPVPDKVNGDWLRKAAEDRGVLDATLTHIFCEAVQQTEETPTGKFPRWFFDTVNAVFAGKNVDWLLREGGARITLPSTTETHITTEYVRAVAKIGFHYFLKFDRHTTGAEERFEPLRRFIFDGTGNWRDFVSLNARPFVLCYTPPKYIAHYFMAESDSFDFIRVRLQFFTNGPYQCPPMSVALGTDEYTRHLQIAHVARLYDAPIGGKAGKLSPILVTRSRGWWGAMAPTS